jgi:hypothetical protein
MRKVLVFVVPLIVLVGCAQWNEAKDRQACEKSHPADPPGAENCVKEAKARYDRGVLWAFFDHHPWQPQCP